MLKRTINLGICGALLFTNACANKNTTYLGGGRERYGNRELGISIVHSVYWQVEELGPVVRFTKRPAEEGHYPRNIVIGELTERLLQFKGLSFDAVADKWEASNREQLRQVDDVTVSFKRTSFNKLPARAEYASYFRSNDQDKFVRIFTEVYLTKVRDRLFEVSGTWDHREDEDGRKEFHDIVSSAELGMPD